MNSQKLRKYIELIESFLQNKIEVGDFQYAYLDMFKNNTIELSDAEFDVLDELFADVDAYYPDSELSNSDDLDEQQLRRRSETALKKLK